MVTKTEAIGNFLKSRTVEDLANLYSPEMECQVNAAQDNGQRTEGNFKGRKWVGWTDGVQHWKAFRIPLKANSEPEYIDEEIKWDLDSHCEGVGLTGWNWKQRKSIWVAFDFDAITGHSDKHVAKIPEQELEKVKEAACSIPWVTVRKSTSGSGLHLYVFLDPVETANHNEHAALARAVLGTMSATAGYDFSSKVDACGGNMWVWHRKMKGTEGLKLLKQGQTLKNIPDGWRDHLKVITHARQKVLPKFIEDNPMSESDRMFAELTGQVEHVQLDEDHKKLLKFLEDSQAYWSWDQDHRMLITHTFHLKEAHEALGLAGVFKTSATGKERGVDYNCFCFPLRRGGWAVRRFTQGVREEDTWDQDGKGWTKCYLNREPDLKTAARSNGGIETPKGDYVFREAQSAQTTVLKLGGDVSFPVWAISRTTTIKPHKDNKIIIEVEKTDNDNPQDMRGWLVNKKVWQKIITINSTIGTEPEQQNLDELVRHCVSNTGEDRGWFLFSDNKWRQEPLTHVQIALSSMGFEPSQVKNILGSSVFKCWTLVNRPFEDEYLGNKIWNKDAAQMRYTPKTTTEDLNYPTWEKVLNHIGSELDEHLKLNSWARANGIVKGSEYLKCWIASLFQSPLQPLPYLFLYGPQNSGKSILHEALNLLLTSGYSRADSALTSQSNYNGELVNAVLCIVEETNLKRSQQAYNKIKDWVSSPMLPIHEKYRTPYVKVNSTHWIQCANEYDACPIFPGDSRITMIYVDELPLEELIPKRRLLALLEKEAQDFLTEIYHLEIPETPDRLNVPVIDTPDKKMTEEVNKTYLEQFTDAKVFACDGKHIPFSEFYEEFINWLPATLHGAWSKIRVGRELKRKIIVGRLSNNPHHHLANVTFDKDLKNTGGKYVLRGEYLHVEAKN
jgi:hypothetical protein